MRQDLAVNLVASLLAFGVGWLGRALVHYYRTRIPAARVWRLDRGRRVVMVVGESGGPSSAYPKIPETDALAAMNLRQFLSQDLGLHEAATVRAGAFAMAADAEENLVVIGGPVHNRVWTLLSDRLDPPYVFRGFPDEYRVVCVESGEEYGESDVDTATLVDHAIVVLANNPFAAGSRLIMIAGCALLATSGATQLFARGAIRALARTYDTTAPLALVVRVESVGGYVRPPEVVAAANFPRAAANRTSPATRS
ncbi:hypothetical protein ABZV29_08775 [Streptomyces sp. NPDC005236]|uniref:hypothetical protein n=1 Tax=Streptomyces sp. NPDC005236 TaxID=3157028 RepID=UPI0033ABA58A